MTVADALREGIQLLSPHSNSARLDAEVLLAYVLGRRWASLIARGEECITAPQVEVYRSLVARRAKGEPVAYLTGHKEFYGLDLLVTPHVLVPRWETESVVEACLEFLQVDRPAVMADIGTGCGAIAVAVCRHRPEVRAYATDISPAALRVAWANAERHGVARRIAFAEGDLLEPLLGPVDLLAANLPYVAPGEAEPDVATWEPHEAVFGGGDDGSALIRRFLAQAPRYLTSGGRVVLETAYSQGELAATLAREAFPVAAVETRKDLAGYDRVTVIQT